MLRTFHLLFFLVTLPLASSATTLWASEIQGFSSEYVDAKKSLQFRAVQLLGKPNMLPRAGSSPCAWSPSKPDGPEQEWIKVGFRRPMYAQQVAIGESFNPGTVAQVWLYDASGKAYLVYQATPQPSPQVGRMLHVFFEQTPYEVVAVKIVLQTSAVPGWNHIDAIGLSDTREPIEAAINEAKTIGVESVEALPVTINSAFDEIFPVISPDGHSLYIDRKNHPQNTPSAKLNDDIWVSQLTPQGWAEAERLPSPINSAAHNFVCSVTPDGNTLLLGNVYLPDGRAAGGASLTTRTADGWSFPKALEINSYQNKSPYSEFYLAPSQKVLLMAIEPDDSYGSRDLYVSFLQADGKWSKPQNLGPTVNSANMELTPFLAADNQTLYFSSSGFSGYGETDMFVTRRLDDTWKNWSEPLNLGATVNSPGWDASFTIDAQGEYAYFVSYKNSNNGSADIFRAKLPKDARPYQVVTVSGRAINSTNQQPVAATVEYEKIPQAGDNGFAQTDAVSQKYRVVLPAGYSYSLAAYAKGYFSEPIELNIAPQETRTTIEQDLVLVPIAANQVYRFKQVNFDLGKSDILPEGFSELDRLVKTLNDFPNMKIQIEGHTDLAGNPFDNMKLSEQRVSAVKSYLVQKGIPSVRILTQAFGSTQPLSTNRDEASQRLNRRVEFRVIGL